MILGRVICEARRIVSEEVIKNKKSFYGFAVLMALCSAAHVSVHLPKASLSIDWLLSVAVFVGSMGLIYRPSVRGLLGLAFLQVGHVVVDAPYNPDHWLLLFFVNLVTLGAALRLWLRGQKITPEILMETLLPGARLTFIVCYGFAAFAKYNSDFLFSEGSVARGLLEHQIGALPALSWIVWPPAAAWVAVACETAVPMLLLFSRTRHIGILVGVVFHAALIISPAVKVYDFTIVVYTMLYLFTPESFDRNLQNWFAGVQKQAPHFTSLLCRFYHVLLVVLPVSLVVTSTQFSLLEVPPQLVWLRWMVAMSVISCLGGLVFIGIFSGADRNSTIAWLPRGGVAYAIVGLAIINGLCPYLGLKTQGSFTMFSNLRTEAGEWNHLIMPESIRVADCYQDRLVKVVASNDSALNKKYVEPGLLATEFEIRRRIMAEPTLALTVERDGQEVVLDPAVQDPSLGNPLGPISRKLLIFRPVSPDGRPFITN